MEYNNKNNKTNTSEDVIETYKSKGEVLFPSITGNFFLVLFVVSLFSFFVSLYYPIFFFVALLFTCLNGTVLLFGYIIVNEKEIIILQRLGVYWKTLEPGLHFMVPFIDKAIYKEPETQTPLTEKVVKLPLFVEINQDENKTIDFLDSAENSVDFGVYYRVVDSTKAAYFAEDLEKYIADMVENAAKAVFGNTPVDDAIENKLMVVTNTLSKLKDSVIGTNEITAIRSLENAGVEIDSVYFNDIGLNAPTKRKREELFNTRQNEKIAEAQEKVEKKNVEVVEQKKLQQQKIDQGIRLGLEAIAGSTNEPYDRKMSIEKVAEFKVDMAKYSKGVGQISEINIDGDQGGIGSTIAGLAAIAGKTAEEATKRTEKKQPKKKEES